MADHIWNGAIDTSWSNDGNWTTVKPVDGGNVIFDGRTTRDALLNVGVGDIDVASFTILESYTGNIGTAAVPLEIEVSGDLLIEGTGSYYIQSASASLGTDGSIDRTIINTTGSVFLSSFANDGANDTDFTTVIVNSGTVTIYGDSDRAAGPTHGGEAGTVIGTLILAPSNGGGSGVTVTVGDECLKENGLVYMNVIMDGGTLNMHSSMLTVTQTGGTINHGTTAYDMLLNGSNLNDVVTTLNLHGGTFKWQPSIVATSIRTTATGAPVITTANIYGGVFDASGMLEFKTTAPTITTAYLYQGATFNLDNNFGQFIVTTLKDLGGTIIKSSGQSLTLS
jgi:hypothetical protein